VKLNYGVDYAGGRVNHFDPIPDTWNKMLHILLFWAGKKVDAFRCDMAEMVPVDFWHWAIPQVKEQYPHVIFIAEVYNPAEYRNYLHYGHFDYLYDKVGLYDTLKAVTNDWISAQNITFSWQQVEGIRNNMLNFLENHDEQRLASAFFAGSPWRALPALYVSLFFNTVPYMLYFGQELGEAGMESEGFSGVDGRTTIFDFWSVASVRSWLKGLREGDGTRYLSTDACQLQCLYRRLFATAMRPVFRYGKTFDLQYANPHNNEYDPRYHFSFLRGHEGEVELVVTNFSEWDAKVKINLPAAAASYLDAPALPTTVTVAVDAWNGVIIKLV
jgi:glycosidase